MILKVNWCIIWSRQNTLKMFPLWFFCFSLVLLGFLLPVLFSYFIAGEKCNFQVKFALVHPVCKNWLKLGKAKTSFFSGTHCVSLMHKTLIKVYQKHINIIVFEFNGISYYYHELFIRISGNWWQVLRLSLLI